MLDNKNISNCSNSIPVRVFHMFLKMVCVYSVCVHLWMYVGVGVRIFIGMQHIQYTLIFINLIKY